MSFNPRVFSSQWRVVLLGLIAVGLFVQLTGLLFNNDGSRYATQVYLLLFLPALVLLVSGSQAMEILRQPAAWVLLAMLAWVLLVASVHEGSDKDALRWSKVLLLISLYVFAVASLVRSGAILTYLIGLALGVVVAFAWLTLVYQYGVLDHPLSYPEVRQFRLRELGWNGLADLDHPIVAGLYYGAFAIMLCWFFVSFPVRLWQGALLALAMLGLLLYVLFTFSRGAWFSLAGAGLLLLLLVPNLKSRALLGLGLLLAVALAIVLWPEIQAERGIGLNNREQIWASWLSRLPDFWLTGSGAGTDMYFRFANGYETYHAHSLYLQLWYELGLVGILLFACLLGCLLWKGWSCREQPLARLGLALLVFAMVAMVSDIYAIFHRPSPYWVVFWFPVGILLGVRRTEPAVV